MSISRRGFLGCAAGVSAVVLGNRSRWSHALPTGSVLAQGCKLVDPGTGCPLRESAAGYQAALSSLNVSYEESSLHSFAPARMMILPAFAPLAGAQLAKVREHLENGSTVLVESGAGFLNPGEFHFHRRLIKSALGLSLHSPIGLWDSADSFKQSPYVDYRWPLAVKVRDFTRVVPVDCAGREVIAWFHELPVAARRRVGKGTLVFLGSPLGPHLLSGDREASSWLASLCSSC